MNIKLSVNTVNQILGYLGSRPYQEVFQLIEAIQSEAKNQQNETQPQAEEQKAAE
jgi:hypothetical protein